MPAPFFERASCVDALIALHTLWFDEERPADKLGPRWPLEVKYQPVMSSTPDIMETIVWPQVQETNTLTKKASRQIFGSPGEMGWTAYDSN